MCLYLCLSFPASQLLILAQPALLADPVQVWYKVLKFIDYQPPPSSTSSSQGGSDPLLAMLQQYIDSILALTLKPTGNNKGGLMWTASYLKDIWVSNTLVLYDMSHTYSYTTVISLAVYMYRSHILREHEVDIAPLLLLEVRYRPVLPL